MEGAEELETRNGPVQTRVARSILKWAREARRHARNRDPGRRDHTPPPVELAALAGLAVLLQIFDVLGWMVREG